MKKVYRIFILFFIVSLMLTGCGKKSNSSKKEESVQSLKEGLELLTEELEAFEEENLFEEELIQEEESDPYEDAGEDGQQAELGEAEPAEGTGSSDQSSTEPDAEHLKAAQDLVNQAVETENYYFETWGRKVWHQGQQVKVELWELVNGETLDFTGERVYAGVILSDHATPKYKQFVLDRKNNKWIIQDIHPMQATVDLMNSHYDILGIRLQQLKEILDGWKGADSEIERHHPHKNNAVTYLELKSIRIREGTVTHQKDNKTWQVYIVEVESFERNKKGSDTIYDMTETFYIDKNSGFPVTYAVSASFNMHVTDTYDFFNVQADVQTEINFDMQPDMVP